jgi:hypothetical protein
MKNYFQRNKKSPYHISIGVVLMNKKKEICTMYLKEYSNTAIKTIKDFHSLVRETLEPNETIEQCINRGLMEELGATAKINSFLGSMVAITPQEDYMFQKTTLYFLCDLISIDTSKRSKEDKEIGAEICWTPLGELILKMKGQGKRLNRDDLDEGVILERIK